MSTSSTLHKPEPVEVETWLERTVLDSAHPVVMFGVDWCGYCWAARDMLQQHQVPFREIDTFSRDALEGFDSSDVRRALRDRTGSHTVPQIFVGGESIGGATELAAALRSGRLSELLEQHGITPQLPE